MFPLRSDRRVLSDLGHGVMPFAGNEPAWPLLADAGLQEDTMTKLAARTVTMMTAPEARERRARREREERAYAEGVLVAGEWPPRAASAQA